MTGWAIPDRILYKDQDVIVLDKPAGLAVHAGPNTPDHLELYLPELCFGWAKPPRLAHRLDRDTSGCLVLGRHDKAIKRLGRMFMQGQVDKTYWTVTQGIPATPQGRVDSPIAKISIPRVPGRPGVPGKHGGWRIVCGDPNGQPAITDWTVLGQDGHLAWVECHPRTGRTHQIRVHMKLLGCPVCGDAYYGPDPDPGLPLHLHSRQISLPALSAGKQPITVTAPPPAHMRDALTACGWLSD